MLTESCKRRFHFSKMSVVKQTFLGGNGIYNEAPSKILNLIRASYDGVNAGQNK